MMNEFDNITRDFKGIWFPKEVWFDERLNALEKIILLEIDSLDCVENGGCFASNDYIAKFCQCSITKVSNAISKLIKLGLIEIVSFDGRTRILKSRLTKFVRQTYNFFKANNNIIENNKRENKNKATISNSNIPEWLKEYREHFEESVEDL